MIATAWLAVKEFFGGISTTAILVAAGIAGAGILTWSIYHAGAASDRAAAAEQLANDNAIAAKASAAAREKAEAATADATKRDLAIKDENAILKEMVDNAAKGNASPGCARAIIGVRGGSGNKAPAAKLPHQ